VGYARFSCRSRSSAKPRGSGRTSSSGASSGASSQATFSTRPSLPAASRPSRCSSVGATSVRSAAPCTTAARRKGPPCMTSSVASSRRCSPPCMPPPSATSPASKGAVPGRPKASGPSAPAKVTVRSGARGWAASSSANGTSPGTPSAAGSRARIGPIQGWAERNATTGPASAAVSRSQRPGAAAGATTMSVSPVKPLPARKPARHSSSVTEIRRGPLTMPWSESSTSPISAASGCASRQAAMRPTSASAAGSARPSVSAWPMPR
jgi:hypothetical protein